jgi:hypothetical protein
MVGSDRLGGRGRRACTRRPRSLELFKGHNSNREQSVEGPLNRESSRRNRVMRAFYLFMALGLTFAVNARPANAQSPQSAYQPQPAVSPYLNLTRGGNLANNYFNLVRPQIDTRNSLQSLQSQVNTLDAGLQPGATAPELSTGHAVQFMNYSKYFGRTPGVDSTNRITPANPNQAQSTRRPPVRGGTPPTPIGR